MTMTPYTPLDQARLSDASDDVMADVYVLPTSFAQRRLWLVDQLEPGRPTYNIPFNLRLAGPLDDAALSRALTLIAERHEVLRTIFDVREGEPVQVVLPAQPVALPVTDLSALPVQERDEELARLVRAEGNAAFDLHRGPVFRAKLIRMAAQDHALLATVHHIAADGWSMGVLKRELEVAYNAYAAGRTPELPELPIQYADFAIWERERSDEAAADSGLAYWLDTLRAPRAVAEIPSDRPHVADGPRRAGRVAMHVPAQVAASVRTLARETATTPFAVLLAAFNILLYRYSGETDIIVGTPTAGRTRPEIEPLIGFFVNTVALRTDVSGTPTFREILGRTRATVMGALAHQETPFEKIVEALEARRDRTRHPIFQTVFSLQDMPNAETLALRGLASARIAGGSGAAKFDLQLALHSSRDGFDGTLEYDTDLFDASTAQRVAAHFEALLRSSVERPDARIDSLDMFAPGERELVVHQWNATSRDYPVDDTLVSLIAMQSKATPDAVAVVAGPRTLTFAALDAHSTALACHLHAIGIRPGALVGICLERSLELMVALLAVLKVGAAYVPIDPDYPADRVEFMLSDADLAVILTQSHLAERLPEIDGMTVVPVDGEWRRSSSPDASGLRFPSAASAAYMIYTSGSTGRPKGAINTHRAIVNRLRWMQETYVLTPADVVLQKTPVSFDVSVWELFWPLIAGAKLVLAAPGGHRDPAYLAETIQLHGVTVCHFVPSMLRVFLAHRDATGCTSLRDVICSGEALSRDLQDQFYQQFDRARLHNLYGPTECAVDVSFWECRRDESGTGVPIGSPVANTQLYVLDDDMHPVPVGIEGELYIAGAQVGAGYHNRPELTAERFVPSPFEHGARMYRTGDRARWRDDGALEYLGRRDGQIKLRGFRIELGEIETVLRSDEAVADCVVDVRVASHGEPLIVAYYVCRDRDGAMQDLRSVLRARARSALPEIMVPQVYVLIDQVPRSPSGKVDRRALPTPALDLPVTTDEHVPPRTTLEHELVYIWEQLLQKSPISIRSDFFDLGGHSLLAARMIFEIERVRGQRVPLASLFDGATIEKLAARLEATIEDEREPDVVVLQSDGTQPPFAFVHGDVRGGGWYCRRMAALLGSDVPLIVLPTLRPGADAGPRTIEAMARAHVATLRRVQPHGPYRLGGFCVGGLIAYEMARQLVAVGERVERVVVVDSSGSNARFGWLPPVLSIVLRGTADERLARRAELLRGLRYYTGRLQRVRRMKREDQWRWVKLNVARRLRPSAARPVQVADVLSFTGERVDHSAEFDARPATQLLRAQERAAIAYIPGPYNGALNVIWAADQFPPRSVDPTRGWARVVSDVRVHMVSSAHVGLITYNLPALAETLRVCLRPEDVTLDS